MATLADTDVRPEFIYAMLTTAAVALLTIKPLAAIGRKSILRWIDTHIAQDLDRLPTVCWVSAPLLAMLLCGVMLPQSDAGRFRDLMAMALLIGLLAALLTNLTRIDALCRLLPDPLTGLLVASGLMAHSLGLPPADIRLSDAVIGCIMGYGLLWVIAWLFKKLRRVDGMGRGDFAMSAGLGAWLGWQSIPMVWMVASLTGIFFALVNSPRQKFDRLKSTPLNGTSKPFMGIEIPFGPALTLGAIATWVQLG